MQKAVINLILIIFPVTCTLLVNVHSQNNIDPNQLNPNCSQFSIIHHDLHCDKAGKFSLKDNCTFHYECIPTEDINRPYQLSLKKCPSNSHFNGLECISKDQDEEDCPTIICKYSLGDFKNIPFVPNHEDANETIVLEDISIITEDIQLVNNTIADDTIINDTNDTIVNDTNSTIVNDTNVNNTIVSEPISESEDDDHHPLINIFKIAPLNLDLPVNNSGNDSELVDKPKFDIIVLHDDLEDYLNSTHPTTQDLKDGRKEPGDDDDDDHDHNKDKHKHKKRNSGCAQYFSLTLLYISFATIFL